MRRAILILALLLVIGLSGCNGYPVPIENQESSSTQDSQSTSSAPTTAKPKRLNSSEENTRTVEKLIKDISSKAENPKIEFQNKYGFFTFRANNSYEFDYKNESSTQLQAQALKNSNEFIKRLNPTYCNSIEYRDCYVQDISSGDNGIDSVIYHFYYYNNLNQQIEIACNSSGDIIAVSCKLNW